MKKKILAIPLIFILVFLISSPIMNSCKKNSDSNDQIAPSLPPVETMKIEFADFNINQKSLTTGSYGTSKLIVGVYSLFAAATVAIPVVLLNEALKKTPTYSTDKWIWTYSVTNANVTYTVELNAKIVGTNIQWELYVEYTGKSKFLLFSGTSAMDGTSGNWLIYDPNTNKNVILIEWTKNVSLSTFDVKYTIKQEGNEYINSYIRYSKIVSTSYNASFEIYNAKDNKNVLIEWNTTNKNGHIRIDNVWYCWDTLANGLVDKNC